MQIMIEMTPLTVDFLFSEYYPLDLTIVAMSKVFHVADSKAGFFPARRIHR